MGGLSVKRYYTLTVRTLSPVHIGCGEEITKIDYCYAKDSKRIYVMHPQKLFNGLQSKGILTAFEQKLMVADKMLSLTRFFADQQITESEYSTWAKYSYPVNNVSVENGQNGIFSFIKDAYDCPYIPGSSLKGALRTALAYSMIVNDRKRFERIAKDVQRKIDSSNGKKPYIKDEEKTLEIAIFNTLKRKPKKDRYGNISYNDILNDCMSGLLISDSKPLSSESLCLCQKTDVDYDGETHSINLLRECIAPETEIVFDVAIDETLCPFKAKDILDALGVQFQDYDVVFREHYHNAVKDTFHDPVQGEDTWLYLGGGTGFPMKTVMYALYEDENQAADLSAALLDASFFRNRPGHKKFTKETGYSPKVWKCTRLHEQLYEMGLCSIQMEEKNA